MNPSDPKGPGEEFEQDVKIDKPGIAGARWWHKSLQAEDRTVQRRGVLKGLAVAGGAIGAISLLGITIATLSDDSGEKVAVEKRKSLQMQKQFGWDFGARGKGLVFDGVSEAPFVRSDLEKLGTVLTPKLYAKYHVPTLLDSLYSQPAMALPAPPDGSPALDSAPFQRLADVIFPVVTAAMRRAYRVGEALSRLCRQAPQTAILVDLPGPEAVAFAAGACDRFEPVLLFDNWPHPHGVVPSHLTLAALAYYQPRFAEQTAGRDAAKPLFVVDHARLLPYSEESDRFDNRYFARMPNLQMLARDGVNLLFYVVASPAELSEPDDMNASLASDTTTTSQSPGVTVRSVALSDFGTTSTAPGEATEYYGGSADTDGSFWVNYPFAPGFQQKEWQTIASSTTKDHRFTPRTTTGLAQKGIGTVPVLVTASGLLIAAALDRKGSMNRFSGGWGG
jgi:hypothetical protein